MNEDVVKSQAGVGFRLLYEVEQDAIQSNLNGMGSGVSNAGSLQIIPDEKKGKVSEKGGMLNQWLKTLTQSCLFGAALLASMPGWAAVPACLAETYFDGLQVHSAGAIFILDTMPSYSAILTIY